ncbi:MAG TPA: DUF262 domain-containing protein [Solirubrobacteraceae bacterium]|jgi:hypothetical protein|nr:DUF262 domain-containing protein [Solirubrobacteraceae bacterium]
MSSETVEAEDEEDDDAEGFPPAERKVVTQSYDLSVQTLLEQWENGVLLLPETQREYVWDNPRGSRLIESLLLNIPIPVLYFAETDEGAWEIFDGQQRVRSVVRFIKNEYRLSSLTVLAELNGKRFFQLPKREQRFLTTRMMRAVVIAADSHPTMKFEIFERLNTGAIILNAQELRNSLFRGSFNSMLRELAKDPAYRECIGTHAPRKRMVDEELALRFFALNASLSDYRPPLKKFLNDYMRGMKDAGPSPLTALRAEFVTTVTRIRDVWGSSAFKVTDAHGKATERSPNRALFDAQMIAFSAIPASENVPEHRKGIIREFAKLFRTKAFMDNIVLATGDRTRTLNRINSSMDALESAGVSIKRRPGLT